MSIYEQVIARWKSQSLSRKPAVNLNALEEFEERHRLKLPIALRRVLLLSNGTTEGEYDQVSHIRFWSLEELAFVKDCAPELSAATYENYLVFADYSVWAHAYAVSIDSGEVVIVGGMQPIFVTGSTESFFALYVSDDPALFREASPQEPPRG